jgi:hypothetical protein
MTSANPTTLIIPHPLLISLNGQKMKENFPLMMLLGPMNLVKSLKND